MSSLQSSPMFRFNICKFYCFRRKFWCKLEYPFLGEFFFASLCQCSLARWINLITCGKSYPVETCTRVLPHVIVKFIWQVGFPLRIHYLADLTFEKYFFIWVQNLIRNFKLFCLFVLNFATSRTFNWILLKHVDSM